MGKHKYFTCSYCADKFSLEDELGGYDLDNKRKKWCVHCVDEFEDLEEYLDEEEDELEGY